MCGIVGYVGSQNAVEVITEALARLEYRGYDSAGICLKERSGSLTQYKKTGKLDNLTKVLAKKKPLLSHGPRPYPLGHPTAWSQIPTPIPMAMKELIWFIMGLLKMPRNSNTS